MGKAREWDCLFILGWEMGFELNFWWEREGIGNHFTNLYFKMGITPSLNEKYEECNRNAITAYQKYSYFPLIMTVLPRET